MMVKNILRVDKFLKVSRLIKRRTVAKNVADANRIYVNDILAKPAKDVKVGDKITLHLGLKVIHIEVLSLTPSKVDEMYTLLSEEKRS